MRHMNESFALFTKINRHTLRVRRWLAFSLRPLSLEELAEVVAIDPRNCPVLDEDEILRNPLDALTICASLLAVSSPDDVQAEYEREDDPGHPRTGEL